MVMFVVIVGSGRIIVLVELGVVELRYQAVLEVLNQGATVTDVAVRFGVMRQTVHRWLRRYASGGLAGLADGTAKPLSCPHQTLPVVEARIVELRRLHPGWGPRTLLFRLEAERVVPLPGRSSVYRCLVRHGLIEPEARRRKKADYRRWERSRSMELWQMDIVGGVQLVNGWKASIVSGIDDHSRFVISAHVVERATARPTCEALTKAMRAFGVPQEILTDIHSECSLIGLLWFSWPRSVDRVRRLLVVTVDRLKPTRVGLDFLPVDRGGERGSRRRWVWPC